MTCWQTYEPPAFSKNAWPRRLGAENAGNCERTKARSRTRAAGAAAFKSREAGDVQAARPVRHADAIAVRIVQRVVDAPLQILDQRGRRREGAPAPRRPLVRA